MKAKCINMSNGVVVVAIYLDFCLNERKETEQVNLEELEKI